MCVCCAGTCTCVYMCDVWKFMCIVTVVCEYIYLDIITSTWSIYISSQATQLLLDTHEHGFLTHMRCKNNILSLVSRIAYLCVCVCTDILYMQIHNHAGRTHAGSAQQHQRNEANINPTSIHLVLSTQAIVLHTCPKGVYGVVVYHPKYICVFSYTCFVNVT